MAKTMAEVLAEHQISVAWESGDDREITCLCGTDLPSEDVRGEIDMNALAVHQAAALSAAGFGLVADAKAEALEEAADKTLGPSDVLLDGATCRWIAMELRESAQALRAAS